MYSYVLDDGEQMHAAAPETFYLPPIEQRNSLKPGDIVKLVFRIQHDGGFNVERMWVQVQEITPAGYVGILDNDPYCTEEMRSGELIPFRPEHVIQIAAA